MKNLITFICIFIFGISLSGCGSKEAAVNQAVIPDDFYFALTWDCYGISSYESRTGKLVKTTDTATPDDYVSYYQLTNEDKQYIYNLVKQLDVNSYPDTYNPGNGESVPPMTLILTVSQNGMKKTIRAEDISHSFESRDKKGKMFLSVCESIIHRLTETEEWKELPEYEHFYD